MFENSNKQTQEKKSTLRCAPSLLFSHEEKLDTTQRGAAQGGFLLLGLFIIYMSILKWISFTWWIHRSRWRWKLRWTHGSTNYACCFYFGPPEFLSGIKDHLTQSPEYFPNKKFLPLTIFVSSVLKKNLSIDRMALIKFSLFCSIIIMTR